MSSMVGKRWFIIFYTFLALLIGYLQYLGVYHDLYDTYAWYDWPMHFLGGTWIGFSLYVLLRYWGTQSYKGLSRATLIVLGTLVVGILWEFLELYTGITNLYDKGYAFDTGHDLLMDVSGGSLAAWLCTILLSDIKGVTRAHHE